MITAHPFRVAMLAAAALVTGALAAGCGGSASSSAVPASTAATGGGSGAGTRSTTTAASFGSGPLAFAGCMRANGVTSFPDPSPGGSGFQVTAGLRSSPAFQSAQVKCRRYMPLPGGAGPSSDSPQQQAQAMAQLRGVAQCMRAHGISDFPDPRASRPANLNPGAYAEITDYMGVFLLFPASINMQSTAWVQAAAACGPLAESFNHPHH
jgi:hypothetical protein